MDFTVLFGAVESPALSGELRVWLSVLNFLEFAIWGAWFVVLGQYLETLKFSRKAIGSIYATMALGTIFAPIVGGTMADRYFNSEDVMGVLHLAGAVLLLIMARTKHERPFYWAALAYALVYSPTLALSNAVIFSSVPDANKFPMIRVLGTIGWIAAGMSLKLFLKPDRPVNNRPLLLAASLSLILSVYSFFLPDTPPKSVGEALTLADAIPFLKALELFKDPSFAVFFAVSFLITIALAFYYTFASLYLQQQVKVRADNVGPLMTIGQWVEIAGMIALEYILDNRLATMKVILGIGMLAWVMRYIFFSLGKPFALVLLAIALHGICFDFFFAAAFVHVDKASSAAIRNSAQSLFTVLTYGLGMYLGNEIAGWLNQRLTAESVDPVTNQTVRVTNWRLFWLVPAIGAAICLVLHLALFKSPEASVNPQDKPAVAQSAQID